MSSTANYYVIIDRHDRSPVAYWLPAAVSAASHSKASGRNEGVARQAQYEDESLLADLLYSIEALNGET